MSCGRAEAPDLFASCTRCDASAAYDAEADREFDLHFGPADDPPRA